MAAEHLLCSLQLLLIPFGWDVLNRQGAEVAQAKVGCEEAQGRGCHCACHSQSSV